MYGALYNPKVEQRCFLCVAQSDNELSSWTDKAEDTAEKQVGGLWELNALLRRNWQVVSIASAGKEQHPQGGPILAIFLVVLERRLQNAEPGASAG
jgi:hypothetical protein